MGYKLTGMYIGSQKVRPSGWQPGANTVAYYPLDSTNTVNDLSGNNHTLTNGGYVNFGTYDGVDCANYNGDYQNGLSCDLGFKLSTTSFTINTYVLKTGGLNECWFTMFGAGQNDGMIALEWKDTNVFRMAFRGDDIAMNGTLSGNTWYNIGVTYDKDTLQQAIYINGQLNNTRTCDSALDLANTIFKLFTGNAGWEPSQFYGNLSRYIIENKKRTAGEFEDYYNQTCSNYGLSPIS